MSSSTCDMFIALRPEIQAAMPEESKREIFINGSQGPAIKVTLDREATVAKTMQVIGERLGIDPDTLNLVIVTTAGLKKCGTQNYEHGIEKIPSELFESVNIKGLVPKKLSK